MPTKITKDTLRQLNAAVGKLDTDSKQVFVGFVGALNMADRLYHGELRYAEPGDTPPAESVSVKAILSPPAKQAATPKTTKGE